MDADAISIIEQRLLYIFSYLKSEMISALQSQGHTVTEKLVNSIDKEINKGVDYVQLDGSFVFYGKFVDTGRKPQTKRVPLDALEKWIIAKDFQASGDERKKPNFSEDTWRKSLAFAIQATIYKKGISTSASWKGTSTANWMTKTLDNNEQRIEDDVFNAVADSLELVMLNALRDIEKKSNDVTLN